MSIDDKRNERDLEEVAQAYFKHLSKSASKQDKEAASWAYDLVSDWSYANSGQALWDFVIAAYSLPMTDEAKAAFAAGPIEDLLAKFGEEYIDRVEEIARRDSKFNELLGGVWKNAISNEVWTRVERARKKVW